MTRVNHGVKPTGAKSLAKKSLVKKVAKKTGAEVEKTQKKKVKAPKKVEEGAAEDSEKARKPYRFRPGTVALRKIVTYQKKTEPLSRFTPFKRLVKEIIQEQLSEDVRVEGEVFQMLQEVGEKKLVQIFEKCVDLALYSHHMGVTKEDFKMVVHIKEN